jgi:putative membrane protein
MPKSLMLAMVLCTGLVVAGAAQSSSSDQSGAGMTAGNMSKSAVSAADKKFVENAAQGGMAEVELGQLAAEKASSDDVKKFGQRMVDDHSKANDQLKQLASSKGIDVPSELNAKDKATKERLSKLSGEQFDRSYMQDMVKDHTKDVSEFQHESKSGKDSEIKNFASQTLPTLQEHLTQAKTVASKNQSKSPSTQAQK